MSPIRARRKEECNQLQVQQDRSLIKKCNEDEILKTNNKKRSSSLVLKQDQEDMSSDKESANVMGHVRPS